MRLAFLAATLVPVGAAAQRVERSGPCENPERYEDWGGTPDLLMSRALGLSAKEVDAISRKMTSPDRSERVAAALELKKNAPGSEQALRQALWSNHGARNAQIREAVKVARRNMKNEDAASQGGLLGALLAMDPKDQNHGEGTRAAIRIMGMLVSLNGLDTMAGYKVILEFSGRHAGIFRKEIGRMLASNGMKVIPALVYARGSKDKELHMFSVKWVRDMGNPRFGEQIEQIESPRRLAQLLEAYASVNELEAVEITLSLANHESVFVRNAARKCLEYYGKNVKWSALRAFENTFGHEAPEGTEVGHWLEKLYEHWDSERGAGAMILFSEGLDAKAEGDLGKMEDRYRLILRDDPMFTRRHEMAGGFLELATAHEEEGRLKKAREASLMAFRVASPNTDGKRKARARLDWLEAETLRAGGAFDEELYRRIAQEDPENEAARKWAEEYSETDDGTGRLIVKALEISLILFLGALLLYLRVRKRRG